MATNITDLIRKNTEDLIAKWNEGNFENAMQNFKDNVVVYSTNMHLVYPENREKKITGKQELLTYWKKLVSIKGGFKLKIISFEKNNNYVNALCIVTDTQQQLNISFQHNEYGKISEINFVYL